MTDVKNTINGTSIKCTFNVAGLNTTTDAALVRAADTTYRMVVGSGTVDGSKSTNIYVYTYFYLTCLAVSSLVNDRNLHVWSKTIIFFTDGLVAFTIAKIGNAIDLSSFLNSTNTTATGGANRPFYSNGKLHTELMNI